MLKQLITEAALEGHKQHLIAEHTKQATIAKQNAEMNAKAASALALIPALVKEAAEKGHNFVCLYRTEWADTQYYGNNLTPNLLLGVGAIVYDTLVREGVEIYIAHNHDGGGRDSWHEFRMDLKKIIHPVR